MENGAPQLKRARREACERFSKLQQAFSMAVHCLLTSCSRQEFLEHFDFLEPEMQGHTYELYTEVVAAVHRASKSEFDTICKEMKLKSVLAGIDKKIARAAKRTSDDLGEKRFTPPSLMVVSGALDVKQSEVEELKRLLIEEEEHKSQLCGRIDGMRAEIEAMEGDGLHVPANLRLPLLRS
ncbi:uncharacterized protein LOC112346512 [Selaginella moellendorffii]|uniref:uncharacterized protein LOC112346512 n=1 Tax=Selaginella moellendorffii TaxID=88036 RepID=UPI000D1C4FA8|nr:uncharacterized protein LOC112346512 [Selaginella moellendorffii]|eukprot:XP_024531405.1 uncharacterized protein LOC112346512 [Selaginella moellendorffii]